jgi:23S rRNA (adenine2503-C2)-methyltransferase
MDPANKPFIFDLTNQELSDLIKIWGLPDYRTLQIWTGIYRNLWSSHEEFTNLPKSLRTQLHSWFSWEGFFHENEISSKGNSTTKVLFKLKDNKYIETVHMRYQERRTICVSTQSGCGMGCIFCATGQMGFVRNLSCGEINSQILFFLRSTPKSEEHPLNIVFMGMGEPFANYESTMKAIDILGDKDGLAIGARRITISTVGLVPEIVRFADERRQVNLSISLHAAEDELRTRLLPINQKYPIKELIRASHYYVEKTHRRISFEWALIHNINDDVSEAKKLVKLMRGLNCHINLIPLNHTSKYENDASQRHRVELFKSTLLENGISCTFRIKRGYDIQAGCGQLAIKEK